jgi:outer membrane receptor protein involved in Fe transport
VSLSRWLHVFCFFVVGVIVAIPLAAQVTGTITGTVRDATGAVIPGAAVTATHTQTGISRSVVTDGTGQYVLPQLVVGNYQIQVTKDGFSRFLQTDVSLQANTQVQVEAVLQLPSATEQVTVSSTPNLIQTNSSNLVQVIDQRRVSDLPLNGRNVLQLISLDASVMTKNVPSSVSQSYNLGQGLYYSPIALAGAKGNAANFLLDNADNNEVQSGMPRPFPNVDAVEEFSIQTNSFDAQYGRGVGGVVNVVTKSGTNAYHGTAFEFLRNFQLNAANFFTGRDALKRNQFGGGFGGPIRKNRTFFFVNYQGTRSSSATPNVIRTAPSAAMKAGDFSAWLGAGGVGAIHDPLSAANGYFPNNMIPKERFDPAAAKMLQVLPTSDTPNYQVSFAVPAQLTSDNQGIVRVDHSLTDRQRLSFRYFVFRFDRPPYINPNLLYGTDGQWGYSQALAANHTYSISSRWVNNATYSYAFSAPIRQQAETPDVRLSSFGVKMNASPDANQLVVNITGWSSPNFSSAALTWTRSMHIADSVSYATGRHNVRFGGETRRYKTGAQGFTNAGGTAGFTGQFLSDKGKNNAGNAYAEFELGVMGSYTQTASYRAGGVQHRYYTLFVQDDMRLTDKLTVNLGLRWDPRAGMRQYGLNDEAWVPGQQSAKFPLAPQGLIFYGDKGIENGAIPNSYNDFAPRVGLAYNFAPKTVVRAAYGIFYDEFQSILYNNITQQFPWANQTTLVGPLSFSDPFGGGPILDPASWKPSATVPFPNASAFYAMTRGMRPGYLQNWNLFVEHQLRSDLLIRAGYVGSKGTHLVNLYEQNAAIYGPGASASNVNLRRPLNNPLIGSLQIYESGANSSYNALQFSVQKRYAKGFSILANYTFGKSIDDNSDGTGASPGPDPWNHRNNIGPSDFDITHRLVVSAVWEMPKLRRSPAAVRWVLGGWQSNAIYTAQTGIPLTIRSGADNNYDGISTDFADYKGGAWDLSGGRSKQDQIAHWFNTSVFTANAIGTIGTSRRGQLRSPGDANLDYSLFKNLPVKEGMRLQFRAEAFNILNHANLGAPGTTVNSPSFGVISSASDPRILQFALKLIF